LTEFKWLPKGAVLAIHARQLAEHGGATGVRDDGLLESALQRPQDKLAYEKPDAADLAAAYAFGIARNHPFVDGNKRTALVVSRTMAGKLQPRPRIVCGHFWPWPRAKLPNDNWLSGFAGIY